MRLRTFYTIAILFPLVVLAAVAALGGGERGLPSRLPPGTTTEWLYPTASVRGLVAYAIVAVWLLLSSAGLTAETMFFFGEATHAKALYDKYKPQVDSRWTSFLVQQLQLN